MHIVLRIERRAGGGGLGLECISLHITGNYYYWSRLEGVGGGGEGKQCVGGGPQTWQPLATPNTHTSTLHSTACVI